jgi:iron complex outermembrane receptor protein
MRFRQEPIAVAVSTLLFGLAATAQAQAQAQQQAPKDAPQRVEVSGIRASIEQSLVTKRAADTNVDVITAEDIGKMPDKNIADALSRLPGLNVQYGGALAMDEAERVAIRGTSPNLNLVTVNGHALSSGDWHVGDQAGSGRSVGFGLMPSQIIGQTIVYKSSRADITEGGISGSVDIIMRKPLSFRQALSGEVSIGAVHAALANKTDPQVSGLINWKNAENNMGFLVQVFKEDRHLRRDGQEIFGYNVITAAQATASGNADLAGKRITGSLNSAMFEGVRQRSGGYMGWQFKPNKDLELNASFFKAELNADNYNSSAYALPYGLVNNAGYLIKDAVITGDVVTGATITRPTGSTANVVGLQFDHFNRQGARSTSGFYDFDAKYNLSSSFTLRGRAGYTEGSGITESQPSLVYGLLNPTTVKFSQTPDAPAQYTINGANGQPIDLRNINNFSLLTNQGSAVKASDKESYFHLDGDYRIDAGWLTNVKVGVRRSKHDRTYDVIGAGQCGRSDRSHLAGLPLHARHRRHLDQDHGTAHLGTAHPRHVLSRQLVQWCQRQLPARHLPVRHGPDEGLHRQVHQLGSSAQPDPDQRLCGQGREHGGLRHGRVRTRPLQDRQLRRTPGEDATGFTELPGLDHGAVRAAGTVLNPRRHRGFAVCHLHPAPGEHGKQRRAAKLQHTLEAGSAERRPLGHFPKPGPCQLQ